MTDYGMDLSLDGDLTEEGSTVTGDLLIAQALKRRWETPRGMLLDDDDYGTDVAENLNADVDALDIARIQTELCAEAEKDERVLSCAVNSVQFDQTKGTLTVVLEVTKNDGGSFRLTIAVSSVSVELLNVEPG